MFLGYIGVWPNVSLSLKYQWNDPDTKTNILFYRLNSFFIELKN